MYIAGIGLVFARGRGIDSLGEALCDGWKPPSEQGCACSGKKLNLAYRVEQEVLTGSAVLRKIRRADRFSKMAVLAACDACGDSGISFTGRESSLGIIVATTFGPHATTFRFLDDVLDYNDADVSPTIFSHSVHNAAASYIASVLDCRGPTLTITQFAFPFQHGLLLARAWLDEGRCDHVLVGTVDECGTAMEYICGSKLRIAEDGKIRPFDFSSSPSAVPGEGSVFFLLTRKESHKKYCRISEVSLGGESIAQDRPNICIFGADGMAGDESTYRHAAPPYTTLAGYAPLFGSMMTGDGFHCAAAALMLEKQMRYANPVQDNPHDMNLCTMTEEAHMEDIHCIRIDCLHEKAVVRLKR